jgi:hypothetical protein
MIIYSATPYIAFDKTKGFAWQSKQCDFKIVYAKDAHRLTSYDVDKFRHFPWPLINSKLLTVHICLHLFAIDCKSLRFQYY